MKATDGRGTSWFKFWDDAGGGTHWHEPTGVPLFRRWKLKNVTNRNPEGTWGHIDTKWHEATHVAIGKYLPQVKDLGRVPLVGPWVKWGEEIVAYSVGHLSVGRLHALPLTPVSGMLSLNWIYRGELLVGAFIVNRAASSESLWDQWFAWTGTPTIGE